MSQKFVCVCDLSAQALIIIIHLILVNENEKGKERKSARVIEPASECDREEGRKLSG